jgi:hypothetical protein
MNQIFIQALYIFYSQITLTRGEKAFDADGNEVTYDKAAVEAYIAANAYKDKRAAEYPPITDYLDAVVKDDQTQIKAYINACLAVKAKYPKGN